jgi:hypothetical protein
VDIEDISVIVSGWNTPDTGDKDEFVLWMVELDVAYNPESGPMLVPVDSCSFDEQVGPWEDGGEI